MTTQGVIEVRPMTAEEFFVWADMPDNRDRRFELVEGEIIEMPSGSNLHQLIILYIGRALLNYAEQTGLGYAAMESNFELDAYNLLIPDVAYVSKTRQPKLPKRYKIAPDLAVEVVSPSNTKREIRRKIDLYIKYGTQVVWVVYPEDEQIEVYRPTAKAEIYETQFLKKEAILEAGDVLPNFRMVVKDIFPDVVLEPDDEEEI